MRGSARRKARHSDGTYWGGVDGAGLSRKTNGTPRIELSFTV